MVLLGSLLHVHSHGENGRNLQTNGQVERETHYAYERFTSARERSEIFVMCRRAIAEAEDEQEGRKGASRRRDDGGRSACPVLIGGAELGNPRRPLLKAPVRPPSAGSIRMPSISSHTERQQLQAAKIDSLALSAAVTFTLRDKGTRLGCELWTAAGVLVRHRFCDRPCLLTTARAMPDRFHANHATVTFAPSGPGEPGATAKLDPNVFMVATSSKIAPDDLIDEFPSEHVAAARLANYSLVALDLEADQLPAHVRPAELADPRLDPRGALALALPASAPSHGAYEAQGTQGTRGWGRLDGSLHSTSPASLFFAPDDPSVRRCRAKRRNSLSLSIYPSDRDSIFLK